MDGVVFAHKSTGARTFGHTNLADDNIAGFDFSAAVNLDTQPLTGTIMDIFAGAASFNLTHSLLLFYQSIAGFRIKQAGFGHSYDRGLAQGFSIKRQQLLVCKSLFS